MQLQDLEGLIKTRRSIRQWKQEGVPEKMVLKAIELAVWAPNGGNQQNWRFVVVSDHAVIRAMADTVQSKVDMMVAWPEAAPFGEDAARWKQNASFFRNAPLCIAVGVSSYQSVADEILKARVKHDAMAQPMIESRKLANSGLQSVSAAIAYLLLALHAQGLGGLWMTGPLIAKTEIEQMLRFPKGHNLAALISVGFPAEEPTKTRKSVSEVVEFFRP